MNHVPLALGQMLDVAAERFPDKPAVVFKDTRVTYVELAARADAFARGLLALGLGPGPRHVEIVSDFPMTGSGKVQKFRQKAWAVERYGFSGPA